MSFDLTNLPTLTCERYPYGKLERRMYRHPISNEFHREDGPAVQCYHHETGIIELESYFVDGILHREDGAAVIWHDRNGKPVVEEYWLVGERLSLRAFMERLMEDTDV